MAIANDEDCEPANDELGLPGDCGSYYPGVVYIIIYLVFSFLVIVNMYIAVILENYTQVQFNEYETIPYFIKFSQNLTSDCLLISVFSPEFTWAEPKIVLNIRTEQF